MNSGFWKKLEKPFSVLAPMAGVTDFAFRQILAEIAKPDVIYTEMVTTEGLYAKGEAEYALQMKYGENERLIVAQIFGSDPKKIEAAARIAEERGFDGVDINMGCPQDIVVRQGAGAGLIRTPELAKEIIQAAKGAVKNIPVSVKTRTGFKSHEEFRGWISSIATEAPAAITIHGRTREMKGRGAADWEMIRSAGEVIREINKEIIILGNGDIRNIEDGEKKAGEYGMDGFMIGRAAIGNPWSFSRHNPSIEEKLTTMSRHMKIYHETFGDASFDRLKTHFSEYLSGFPGAKDLRERVMLVKSPREVEEILASFKV